jgi:thiamine-monophosphate kinase
VTAGEFDFIRQIRAATPPHPRVLVGPGDDCAVLAGSGRLLVTTDVLTEGVDFILSECGSRAVGRKAMAVNLSDIAAMGGRPLAAVVGVVVGRDLTPPAPLSMHGEGGVQGTDAADLRRELASVPRPPGRGNQPGTRLNTPLSMHGEGGRGGEVLEALHHGLRDVADRFHTPLVGGDTNSWDGGLVVSVTVLGEPIREPILRNGAKAGDWIFVTGPCGGSILVRHLNPTPRLKEAELLVTNFTLHAMIDVSDGLAKDLSHILEESGCGAVLDANAIPIHPEAVELSKQSGKPPLEHALGDGEDFELVFTVDAETGAKLLAHTPVPVWKIGECVPESGLWLTDGGVKRVLPPSGWEHVL